METVRDDHDIGGPVPRLIRYLVTNIRQRASSSDAEIASETKTMVFPTFTNLLTDKLAALKQYVGVPAEYFRKAAGHLRDKFLNVALTAQERQIEAEAPQRRGATPAGGRGRAREAGARGSGRGPRKQVSGGRSGPRSGNAQGHGGGVGCSAQSDRRGRGQTRPHQR